MLVCEQFLVQSERRLRGGRGSVACDRGDAFAAERTCVSGQTCMLHGIHGHHLSETDSIAILDTCGMGTVVPRFPAAGEIVVVTNQSGASWSWGNLEVTAAGGKYRMCWCGGSMRCDVVSDFAQDIGELTMRGVSTSLAATCVSGQVCTVSTVEGQGLVDGDRYMLLDTCGSFSLLSNPRLSSWVGATNLSGADVTVANGTRITSVSWGTHVVTAKGGSYRLCWCADEFSCELASSFRVDAGELVLIGPSELDQTFTCVDLLVYLLTALGWKTMRANLYASEIRFAACVAAASFYFGVFEVACVGQESCGGYMLSRLILHSLAYLCIIVALNFNLAMLRAQIADSTVSLEAGTLYRKQSAFCSLRWVFLVFICQPTAMIFIKVSVLTWEEGWVFDVMTELVKFSLLLAVTLLYGPRRRPMALFEAAVQELNRDDAPQDG